MGKTIGKGRQFVKQLIVKEDGVEKLFAVKLFENDKESFERFVLEKKRLEKIAKIECKALHIIDYFGEYDEVLVKFFKMTKILIK